MPVPALAPGANGIQRFGDRMYVTTIDAGMLVRVDSDGRRAVIASGTEHVTGATDCAPALGGDADGEGELYVLTDGDGLLSGDPSAAGALVALSV